MSKFGKIRENLHPNPGKNLEKKYLFQKNIYFTNSDTFDLKGQNGEEKIPGRVNG
jgi:hypothetical protein